MNQAFLGHQAPATDPLGSETSFSCARFSTRYISKATAASFAASGGMSVFDLQTVEQLALKLALGQWQLPVASAGFLILY
jgi:hypothetical protein